MNDKWKTLSRDRILHTPVFDIYKEKGICRRNNFEWDFYTLDCPFDWVNVVAVTPDKDIVMVKQFRYGSKKSELEVPGGLADNKGETPIEAGIRELKEETGYVGNNPVILGKVCPNPALQGNYCYTILVENAVKQHEPELDDAEDIKTCLIKLGKLDEYIENGEISHGLVLNALFFYKLKMNKNKYPWV